MLAAVNLEKTYRIGSTNVHALRGVSLTVEAGEFVAIMGPSGSGKSTLMHLLGFLDKPDHGKILFGGEDVTQFNDQQFALLRNQAIGFVFQQFNLLSRTTAFENVALPQLYAESHTAMDSNKVREFLEKVGLGDRMQHKPSELSGGQQQRVALARALVNNPSIILADEPTGNLDSHTGGEIMRLLAEINGQGHTIILVTHDEAVARHARRVVRMVDGRIVSDERTDVGALPVLGAAVAVSHDEPNLTKIGRGRARSPIAKFRAHFRQAFRMLLANKMRSFLSMLGVLIGVGCVIAMVALGRGARQAITEQLSRLGSNVLSVRPGSAKVRGVALEAGAVTSMTLQDAKAIQTGVPGVAAVAPQVNGGAHISWSGTNWSTRVLGTTPEYAEMRAQIPVVGRFFNAQENAMRKRVVVIGRTIARELFGTHSAVGEFIKLNRTEFQVIGILPEQGSTGSWRDQDDVIVIPLDTAMYRVLNKQYLDAIDVQMSAPEFIASAQDQIRTLIARRHRLTPDRQDTFDVRDNTQMQEALSSTTKTFSALLGAVAAISLVVGGIGIMNIMLVSVNERTREIGLRKALGATSRDILSQFLVESVVITFLGGAAGIGMGMLVSWLITRLAGWATVIGADSILFAFLFSAAVGIVFGLWPAKTAAKLDPITSLRSE